MDFRPFDGLSYSCNPCCIFLQDVLMNLKIVKDILNSRKSMKPLKREVVTFYVSSCLCIFRHIPPSKRRGRTGAVHVPHVLPLRGGENLFALAGSTQKTRSHGLEKALFALILCLLLYRQR